MYVTRHANTRNTQTNYPFLSGDVFRAISDHIIDDTHQPFFPNKVKEKEILFVKTRYLKRFFRFMHPHIKNPYILVTHNGDEEVPGEFRRFLDDPKIIVWFGTNATLEHPKLKHLPIGFGNTHEPTFLATDKIIFEILDNPLQKEQLVYLNFDEKTYPAERVPVKEFFLTKDFCTKGERKCFAEFISDVMRSKFVISPRGNGIDCCRVWESLVVGSIPIVKTSSLDSLYQDLPILIVNDWSEVTQEFLENKYLEMSQREYCLEKIYADYWIQQIISFSGKQISHQELAESSRFERVHAPKYIPVGSPL